MRNEPSPERFGALLLALSLATVALAAGASLTGLLADGLYREAPAWLVQCHGQDLANLIFQMPALAAAAVAAARGCRRAALVWFGLMIANVYTYAIYGFGVHQNALYLVYCAVLGLSLFAALVFLYRNRRQDFASWFDADPPRWLPGLYLVVVAALFLSRWLSIDLRALSTGAPPPEVTETGLPVNLVHTLDYAFLLPAMLLAGLLLIRRHDLGSLLAPALLAFSASMTTNIVVLMLYTRSVGGAAPLPVIVVIAGIGLLAVALLALMLRNRQTAPPGCFDQTN